MTANSLVKSIRAIKFAGMHRFAKLLMLLALILQGFMPAMAMAPPPVTAPDYAPRHGMSHEQMMETKASGSHAHHQALQDAPPSPRDNSWHCPLLPANCTMAFCIACTALPPPLISASGPIAAPDRPAPALMSPMSDETPRPLVPPPRT
ncbi:hypothetical protein ASD54_03290 [Rhizobium sp. Root149]|uniref:Uncharacterized protein n=1 Tax=Rhizobium rhizoryzae TaxID=451876 RepID=A0A7W6LET9_9HYPH|nr:MULTISPECIES: hypothetical protein [Rhizobium]KQZ63392.1 hypothetical protein ASD54_03290 [Rhizobium sp. Root149]MBB4143086.1 hypothetical protein [Rhizobium rhizoryzae]